MKTVCFNSVEKSLRTEAAKVLDNPLSAAKEKYRAQKLLRETLESARQRYWKLQARKRVGTRPVPQDFSTEDEFKQALEIYRDGLDKLACEELLDTPGVSLGKRVQARKILEAIERREKVRGTVRAPHDPPRAAPAHPTPAARPEPKPPDDVNPAVENFFHQLEEDKVQ